MNKRILISLSVIGIVAGIAVGGTIAYFSDIETSSGNSFIAGKLDLIVDIDGVPKNPLNEPIFSYVDMKPGDSGERTISLTIDNNPSCGFVHITKTSDRDVSCTEPEIADESVPGCAPNNNGELDENTQFVIWSDMGKGEDVYPGDNEYNPECGDVMLAQGNLVGDEDWAIGELNNMTKYYGVAWCVGVFDAGLNCNGANVNNAAQTDSFMADLIITAKQKRNQYTVCPIQKITAEGFQYGNCTDGIDNDLDGLTDAKDPGC